MIVTKPLKSALFGAAAAALVAAPASADLGYYWTYSDGDSAGEVVNTLNFISSADSFVAGLYAQTTPVSPFIDVSGDKMPDAGSQSFFSGGFEIGEAGYEDPLLAGSAFEAGGTFGGPLLLDNGTIDATWISNWPLNSFPTGDISDPIKGGQFTLADDDEGSYGFRLSNAEEVVLHLTGVIENGRFSQRLPGDANINGTVNGQDLAILAGNFGTSGKSVLEGDFSGDGLVNGQDLAILAANFGASAPAPAQQGSAAVPEPTSLALLALGGLMMARRRRA